MASTLTPRGTPPPRRVTAFFSAMVLLVASGCAAKADRITPAALHAGLVADPAHYALVDVRLGSEFNHGHIEGAVHLPYPGTLWHTDRVTPRPGQTVVLICYTGHRSRFPMRAMRKRHPGVEVVDLEGGMRAWWAAGLPSTRDP